jgi:hypothetical protein
MTPSDRINRKLESINVGDVFQRPPCFGVPGMLYEVRTKGANLNTGDVLIGVQIYHYARKTEIGHVIFLSSLEDIFNRRIYNAKQRSFFIEIREWVRYEDKFVPVYEREGR